jgi:hypothetical protein
MGFYDPSETLAYCAGNCQASRYPPSTCRCPCLGRNHGILRNRVIDVTGYRENYPSDRIIPLLPEKRLQLTAQNLGHNLDLSIPHIQPQEPKPERLIFHSGKARIAKKIGKKLFGIRPSESELNEGILKGLRQQFNEQNTEIAIDQAFSVFYSHDPNMPRPELYELYETGLIDKALELMGKRWVIGRPKK